MNKIAVVATFDNSDDRMDEHTSYDELYEEAEEYVGGANLSDFEVLDFDVPYGDNKFTSNKILAAIEEHASSFSMTLEEKNNLAEVFTRVVFK